MAKENPVVLEFIKLTQLFDPLNTNRTDNDSDQIGSGRQHIKKCIDGVNKIIDTFEITDPVNGELLISDGNKFVNGSVPITQVNHCQFNIISPGTISNKIDPLGILQGDSASGTYLLPGEYFVTVLNTPIGEGNGMSVNNNNEQTFNFLIDDVIIGTEAVRIYDAARDPPDPIEPSTTIGLRTQTLANYFTISSADAGVITVSYTSIGSRIIQLTKLG